MSSVRRTPFTFFINLKHLVASKLDTKLCVNVRLKNFFPNIQKTSDVNQHWRITQRTAHVFPISGKNEAPTKPQEHGNSYGCQKQCGLTRPHLLGPGRRKISPFCLISGNRNLQFLFFETSNLTPPDLGIGILRLSANLLPVG